MKGLPGQGEYDEGGSATRRKLSRSADTPNLKSAEPLAMRSGRNQNGTGSEKESVMPLYMSTFGYKPEVWAELIHSSENRTETVGRILENAGCKLKGLWYAFGEGDGFALIEAPDNVTGASISIAIGASGAFRKYETTV